MQHNLKDINNNETDMKTLTKKFDKKWRNQRYWWG